MLSNSEESNDPIMKKSLKKKHKTYMGKVKRQASASSNAQKAEPVMMSEEDIANDEVYYAKYAAIQSYHTMYHYNGRKANETFPNAIDMQVVPRKDDEEISNSFCRIS